MGQHEDQWNEWGFIDYSIIADEIISLNKDILSVDFEKQSFDLIYSVSVIEHLSSKTRIEIWKRVSMWLKQNGTLLVTLDLVPDSNQLWNYNMGKQVEATELHGDLATIEKELIQNKIRIIKQNFARNLTDSRTDCVLLKCIKFQNVANF